jgi:hypothetical protein
VTAQGSGEKEKGKGSGGQAPSWRTPVVSKPAKADVLIATVEALLPSEPDKT